MRPVLFALVIALVLAPAAARAAPIDVAYASALRSFAPQLDAATSRHLAARAIAAADRSRLDARLVVALVAVESSWRIGARSSAGAVGLGQLMPQTAATLGVDPLDPDANLEGTVQYLRSLLDHYGRLPPQVRYEHAIAAYNAGPGAVDRYGAIPPFPETQAYVRRVIGVWRRLCGE